MKITVVAVSMPAISALIDFAEKFKKEFNDNSLQWSMFSAANENSAFSTRLNDITKSLIDSDLAIIDIMGASDILQEAVRNGLECCKGTIIVMGNECREYNRLGSFSMSAMRKKTESAQKEDKGKENQNETEVSEKPKNAIKMMHLMRRVAFIVGTVLPFGITKDMKNLFRLVDYWQQAEEEDIRSFMFLILREYFGKKELPKEKNSSMQYGIYLKNPETGEIFNSLKKYILKYFNKKKQDTIAMMFYGHSYPNDFKPIIAEVYKELSQDFNILPIAFSQNEDKDLETLESFLCSSVCKISAVINFMPFRLGAGPMGGDADRAVEILKKLNVPYFKPFAITKVNDEEWKNQVSVNPGEFLISILLPELDGGIHTYPIGIIQESKKNETLDINITKIYPMNFRIQQLCRRIQNFIKLQTKTETEKKPALIVYNYPPGEDNLFGASFLDVFESLANILRHLQKEGYNTEALSSDKLKEIFQADGMCNMPLWADDAVSSIVYNFEGKKISLKGIILKNIFIGLQPVRGENKEESAEYHDKNIKPSDYYQAFYSWIQNEFKADALVHIGTHGTLEFLPGKENGISSECWPDLLTGDLPHFYYYYMGNPSEAAIAKRRSNAVLISYLPPAFKEGGLYGNYVEIKEMISEYRSSLQVSPESSNDVLNNIEQAVKQADLIGKDEKFSARVLDSIEEKLYEYEMSLIPDGLHIIGEPYTEKEACSFAERIYEYKDDTSKEKLIENLLNNRELDALTDALNGKYLPAAPAGDFTKNSKMIPSGQNLVQFDPRAVPTKTAIERGSKVAEQSLQMYMNEHGFYPESAAVILWGLETSKTQGETIGQIMYYLGIEINPKARSFDNKLKLIPAERLGRPRIDVIVHICGFFRDMYPNLLDNFNEMLRQLALLNEDDKTSSFAKNYREKYTALINEGYSEKDAEEFARSRFFGPKENEYGSSLTESVRQAVWKDKTELGDNFLNDLSFVYGTSKRGINAKNILKMSYKKVGMISQVRNNTEYELTDLDHYYEFYGGLSRAVENIKGAKASLYVADTTSKKIKTQPLEEAIEKGVRTRLLNPAWIDGMMKHDYHGVQQISKRFENLIGFASSTETVKENIFSKLEKQFVEDSDLKERMQKSNKWAYLQILNRLVEANNRGLWNADENELDNIRKAYLETESEVEK